MQPIIENAINIPAFLSKLWKMVNDPGTDHLICWSTAGNSFYIQNQAQFWYELLPLYYKHNNMSSFVRQLNMYGFHKLSTFENGTMDSEKDEIQFFHPYFQRDQPELLKLIKRKVTAAKGSSDHSNGAAKSEELSKVLDDVKQLRGRQASVDSQLTAMKHENAVLWRELAVLRQKHMKQQQIVNKLIQFLVTCVQPRMNGVLVKRRFPLMLHGSPAQKKGKSNAGTNAEGPTIHELDTADALADELLIDDDPDVLGQSENAAVTLNVENEQVQSPTTPQSTSTVTSQTNLFDESPLTPAVTTPPAEDPNVDNIGSDIFWDSPEFICIKPEGLLCAQEFEDGQEIMNDLQNNSEGNPTDADLQRVFLNPSTQDVLLSNLTNGSYNTGVLNKQAPSSSSSKKPEEKEEATSSNTAVAKRDPMLNRLNSADDLDLHLDNTQSELDQLKDILNGCNSLDANALLGLFNDESPDYGLSYNRMKQNEEESGSELAMYDPGNGIIDFSELLDDPAEAQDLVPTISDEVASTINTPQVPEVPQEPVFPTPGKSPKKRTQ